MYFSRRTLATLFLTTATASAFAQWNAADDFSIASNPNGVWSYGWSNGLLGSFTLDSQSNTSLAGFSGVDDWTANIGGSGNPSVVHNSNNVDVAYSSLIWKAHQMTQHPGPNGEYSIVRFTAPSTGGYDLTFGFIGQDLFSSTTDVHVLINGTSIFDGAINGYGSTSGGSVTNQSLMAGDTVDLRVGFGGANYFGDTTGSNLVVTPVPEPASLAALGFGALAFLRKKRK